MSDEFRAGWCPTVHYDKSLLPTPANSESSEDYFPQNIEYNNERMEKNSQRQELQSTGFFPSMSDIDSRFEKRSSYPGASHFHSQNTQHAIIPGNSPDVFPMISSAPAECAVMDGTSKKLNHLDRVGVNRLGELAMVAATQHSAASLAPPLGELVPQSRTNQNVPPPMASSLNDIGESLYQSHLYGQTSPSELASHPATRQLVPNVSSHETEGMHAMHGINNLQLATVGHPRGHYQLTSHFNASYGHGHTSHISNDESYRMEMDGRQTYKINP